MSVVTNIPLCRLVLDWMKRQLTDETLNMIHLLERTHLLYLALDNSLQDCSDLPPGHESESDLVQDYKRLVLKCPNNKGRRKCLAAPVRPRVLIYSRDIGTAESEVNVEPDWNVIGSAHVSENTFVSLVTLNGQLTRISIQLRLNVPPITTPSPVHAPDMIALNGGGGFINGVLVGGIGSNGCNSINSNGSGSASGSIGDRMSEHDAASCDEDEPEMFLEVAPMSGPKCGLGVTEWNGQLLVAGGYDRGECLRFVESYNPVKNEWTAMPKMNEARGRVQIAVLNGDVYAVGGSNGTNELDTVECMSRNATKWQKRCRLPMARSNAGVCTIEDRLYCVGGWNGQSGIKQCEVYRQDEDKWRSMASLLVGRYQSGIAAFNGQLWVAGGSDAWNCLASVERYDPDADKWTMAASLLTPRRGCGLASFNGRLYAVGGSDGTHSLSSTEMYDAETKTWCVGPSLTTARANVSCVAVAGKLYAIGGFAGKCFLNTLEYLDSSTNEWTTFVPQSSQLDVVTDDLVHMMENLESVPPQVNGGDAGGERKRKVDGKKTAINEEQCDDVFNEDEIQTVEPSTSSKKLTTIAENNQTVIATANGSDGSKS